MSDTGRVSPQSLEAERSVLGGILVDPNAMDQAIGRLTTTDFFLASHRHVWEAMVELHGRNAPIDILSLGEVMRRRGTIPKLEGGEGYLIQLASEVPHAENIGHYIGIVVEKSLARQTITACAEISSHLFGDYGDFEEAMDEAEARMFSLTQRRGVGQASSAEALLPSLLENLESRLKARRDVTGVPSGLRRLDLMTMGLQPEAMVVLAARPGKGKTSLALNIASHAAIRHRIPVCIFSLEMSKAELMERLLSAEARVPGEALRRGNANAEQWRTIWATVPTLRAPITIHDTAALTIHQIAGHARTWRADRQWFPDPKAPALGLVVVDYIQLAEAGASAGKETREQQVSKISRGLKALAKNLRVPVLAISQLNRDGVKDGKRPTLLALRDSGAIEQDADQVIFIHHEEDDPPGKRHIIIEKNRNGALGTIPVLFRQDITRFENYAEDVPDEDSRYPD